MYTLHAYSFFLKNQLSSLLPSEEVVPFLLEVDRPLFYLTAIPMRLDVIVFSFLLQVLVVVVVPYSLLISEEVSLLLQVLVVVVVPYSLLISEEVPLLLQLLVVVVVPYSLLISEEVTLLHFVLQILVVVLYAVYISTCLLQVVQFSLLVLEEVAFLLQVEEVVVVPFPPLLPSEEVPFLLEVDRPLFYLTAIPMRLDVVVFSFLLQVLVVVVIPSSLLVSEEVVAFPPLLPSEEVPYSLMISEVSLLLQVVVVV
jgi:hypothetical protein